MSTTHKDLRIWIMLSSLRMIKNSSCMKDSIRNVGSKDPYSQEVRSKE
jgi:hypothetical protein